MEFVLLCNLNGLLDDDDAIPQRNIEHSPFHSTLGDFELVDQPCRKCTRFPTYHR